LWTGVLLTLPNFALLNLAFAFFVTIGCISAFQQVFLNAFNELKSQIVSALLVVAVLFPAKYIILNHGMIYGIVVAASIANILKFVYFDSVVRRHISAFQLLPKTVIVTN